MPQLMTAVLLFFATFAQAAPQRFQLLPYGHAPNEEWTEIATDAAYTGAAGVGYEQGRNGEAFRFSVKEAEGNYRVTLTLGNPSTTKPSTITVKAESRRLMLERVAVPAGAMVTRTFVVNLRTPSLPDGNVVKISQRETGAPHWDDKLSLEFLGESPVVSGIEIEPAPDVPTVFLAGDSTVTDQAAEPWAGWGMMLPRFLRHDVAVANYAESGRSLTSFAAERRLAKILGIARPGDFLFIQMGHNDMKEKGDGMGAFENYSTNLRTFIAEARAKQMTPVLITSMHRRRFREDGKIQNTFGNYIAAMKKVAEQEKTPLIDLNAMSGPLYESLGVEGSKRLFVHYPANTFPGQTDALKDDTHHNNYGAYELAKCVVEGLRTSDQPQLRGLLRDDIVPFDPAKPDPADANPIPPSLANPSTTKPTGS